MWAMADATEDVSKPEVDAVEEIEGDGKGEDSSTTEAAADASVSAGGDVDGVATDVNASDPAAVDSTSAEEEKHAIDASDAVDAAVLPEADAADESEVAAAAAAAVADDNVTVVMSEAETDESKEVTVPVPDETATAVSPSTGTAEETPDESDKADAEASADKADAEVSADATTDRIERVTCKADKVTVSVETTNTVELSEGVEVSRVDTTAVETRSEPSASDVVQNKTTQDVMNMAGNDELKFGVLIGLVRIGQLSNKDVVDSVLCLVSTFFLRTF